MGRFLLGVLFGVLAAWGVTALLDDSPAHTHDQSVPKAKASTSEPAIEEQPQLHGPAIEQKALKSGTTAPNASSKRPPDQGSNHIAPQPADLPPGEFILRAGQGIDLDRMRVVTRDQQDMADVVVNEIWSGHGGMLGTHHGGANQRLPSIAPQIQIMDVSPIIDQLSDAPQNLREQQVRIYLKSNHYGTGVGFAQSTSGRVYRLRAIAVSSHPVVIDRTIHVEAMETKQGAAVPTPIFPKLEYISPATEVGGHFRDVTTLTKSKLLSAFSTLAATTMNRTALLADELPVPIRLTSQKSIAFRKPPRFSTEANSHSGITVLADVEQETTIKLGNHSTLYITGDLLGAAHINHHSTLVVEGNIYGTVTIGSQGVVILYGDVEGDITVKSHATVFLAGSSQPIPTMNRAPFSKVFLARRVNEQHLKTLMPNKAIGVTLHIPESDLEAKRHKGIHGFKEVVVGGPVWQMLGR